MLSRIVNSPAFKVPDLPFLRDGCDLEMYEETNLSSLRLSVYHTNIKETRLEQAAAVVTHHQVQRLRVMLHLFLLQVCQELHGSGLAGLWWGRTLLFVSFCSRGCSEPQTKALLFLW